MKVAFPLVLVAGPALLVLLLPHSAEAVGYGMHALEGVSTPGFAESINNAGVVFGNSSLPELQVFLWSRDGGVVNLRDDNLYVGVNDQGQTAGSYTNYESTRTNPRVRYADGTIVDYSLPSGAFGAWPGSMNDIGQIGCTVEYRDSASGFVYEKAAVYSPDGNITLIPLDGSVQAGVSCLNNDGYAVVRATTVVGQLYANCYVWKADTDLVELESFQGAGDIRAYDINDDGLIVGTSGGHAVWWDLSGNVHDLGAGEARGINSFGQIAGASGGRPVLWATDSSVLALPVADGVGGMANGINDNGWVVGYIGVPDVGAQAVLWNPVPEPASLSTLALALAGVGVGVARRRR